MKYDIAIIGGGPAGLSAAITASSKGRKVVVFEAHGFSPRLRSVELITDYMGCPDISGNELMDRSSSMHAISVRRLSKKK